MKEDEIWITDRKPTKEDSPIIGCSESYDGNGLILSYHKGERYHPHYTESENEHLEKMGFKLPENMKCEYGCVEPVRFLDESHVTMYDENNEIVYCKCGNKATGAMMGKDASIAYCSKCMWGNDD